VARTPAGRAGVRIPADGNFSVFSKMSRPAVGPNQPLIQRAWSFFPEGKVAEEWGWPHTLLQEWMELYFYSPNILPCRKMREIDIIKICYWCERLYKRTADVHYGRWWRERVIYLKRFRLRQKCVRTYILGANSKSIKTDNKPSPLKAWRFKTALTKISWWEKNK
jgi:hypothetical protein